MWTDIYTLLETNLLCNATSRIRKFRRSYRLPFYQVADLLKDVPLEGLETVDPFVWPKRRHLQHDIGPQDGTEPVLGRACSGRTCVEIVAESQAPPDHTRHEQQISRVDTEKPTPAVRTCSSNADGRDEARRGTSGLLVW